MIWLGWVGMGWIGLDGLLGKRKVNDFLRFSMFWSFGNYKWGLDMDMYLMFWRER